MQTRDNSELRFVNHSVLYGATVTRNDIHLHTLLVQGLPCEDDQQAFEILDRHFKHLTHCFTNAGGPAASANLEPFGLALLVLVCAYSMPVAALSTTAPKPDEASAPRRSPTLLSLTQLPVPAGSYTSRSAVQEAFPCANRGAAAPRDEVVEAASRPTTLPDSRVCMACCGLALPGGPPSNAPTYLYE